MTIKSSFSVTILLLIFLASCGENPKEKVKTPPARTATKKDSVAVDSSETKKEEEFVLTEDNAIDFFFNYQKDLKADKVKITTRFGSFTVQLYDNVPYHKANFIYLARKGYFDNTQFHRVVKNFIIQGGNSDDRLTGQKRSKIGRYLLPPDTRKGHRHHRGTISMPSSEIDNPHMLASPYEFFIVVTDPGSYHLDGDFTPFGKVIQGMDVVDAINQVETGDGDWPSQNIYIQKAEVIE
ncbi:Peptidyl-prolyl cis-trans isomerase (rotamase)-cyclophilin family [Zobellia uliginosa]|uniref:Peptidyl-prolyl cis-trans isomerase n=1 Tax=Zobellia uliginosa TaxID=143224 RepID=A0ABY1L0C0_9FLAO|nr:peptidylprolyl isomerase [Zobellia uliginosa]SIS98743.1 Peptidyl-prolyl cis-trans isomerase (rotamase)-cyclophilin family [Zobellia uliginosa]